MTPTASAVADAEVEVPVAPPDDLIVSAPVEAAEPLPRRRARIASPLRPSAKPTPVDLIAPAPPAAVPVIDLPTRTVDELRFAADVPERQIPVRHVALPAPFPWAPFIAGCVASFILGGVAMRDWMQRSPSPAVAAGPAVPSPAPPRDPAPNAPVATDTEVRIPETEPTPRDTSKSGSAPAAVSGRLVVKSAPAGASVVIDGKAAGQTPLTVNDLALSSHSVAVSKPGFVTETRRVVLSAKAPSSALQVSLDAERPAAAAKAASTGSITVDSRPKGARVTIDGRSIGVTPLSAPGMKPGTHTVRVELAGHKPVVTTVVVKAGETAKLAVTLEQR